MNFDLVIIGGGPAGLSAAIYGTRGGLTTAVIEKQAPGGQIVSTSEIENYPGVDKESGYELAMKMMNQAEGFGAQFIFDEVQSVDVKNKKVKLASDEISYGALIIATGAYPRKLNLEAEARLTGKGVSYCATCDGAFFKGKKVAVNGGGNTAVEDALYLKNFASEVYLIHRRDSLRAEKTLADALLKSGVKIIWDSVVENINGDDSVESLTLKNVKTNELSSLQVDGLFVAVGQVPESKAFDWLELDAQGYVITKEDMSTAFEGVFAAGDLRQKPLRQVVTAASDGAIAANSAIKYLTENGLK